MQRALTGGRPVLLRAALLCCACLGFLVGCGGAGQRTGASVADARPPNILLILVDDLGAEWISAYGAEEIVTPNIDRLAETGMLFSNAYSMPQCTPSRVTLLTGQYPWRHGWVNHWDVPRRGNGVHFDPGYYTTFARLLREVGYTTAAAGKWQISDFRVQPAAMRRHGFDRVAMWTGGEAQNPPSDQRYWDPYVHTAEGSRTLEGAFGPDVFADFLIDFMRRHRDQPMLLYYPMVLTHGPFTNTPLEPDVTGREERYAAMVRYADHLVGRLIAALEETGLRENTVVIFTTDNGSPGRLQARANGRVVTAGKATLGESGVRVPFIVSAPGVVPSGVRTDALVDFTDLLPTMMDLAGTALPDTVVVDGRSFADLLLGRANDGPRDWILALGFGHARWTPEGIRGVQDFTDRVVRDKRFKLWVLDREPAALYDLRVDPGESRNLIDSQQPEHVAAREKLWRVVASTPRHDAAPRYDPTAPQPWDEEGRRRRGK